MLHDDRHLLRRGVVAVVKKKEMACRKRIAFLNNERVTVM